MSEVQDLTGQTFGRLTVVSQALGVQLVRKDGRNNGHRIKWNVVCSCSPKKEFVVHSNRLLSKIKRNQTRSCGCLRDERVRAIITKAPYTAVFNQLCANAKLRGIEVSLTLEDYAELAKNKICHYCDLPLVWAVHSRNRGVPFTTNVDRKDSSKGYTVENCVPCCGGCNVSKQRRSYKEWRYIGKAIKAYREDAR